MKGHSSLTEPNIAHETANCRNYDKSGLQTHVLSKSRNHKKIHSLYFRKKIMYLNVGLLKDLSSFSSAF